MMRRITSTGALILGLILLLTGYSDGLSNPSKNRKDQSIGTIKWKFRTGNTVTSSPAIGPDGTIYFGSLDGKIYTVTPFGKKR